MRTDGFASYETWGLTMPVIPPRSRLYNLSPIGFGTPMVECLTSYFSRLAEAHCFSPGVLVQHELMPHGAGARNMFSFKTNGRARCFTSCINGKDSVAGNFVSVLGNLTGRGDLKYLTMIPWKRLLPSKLLMRKCRRLVSRLPDRLGTIEQNRLCTSAVDLGSRQVLPLPSAPSTPHLPALQTCARGARPTVAGGLLCPLQALACCRFGQGRFQTRLGPPSGNAGVGNVGGEPGCPDDRSRVSQPAVIDQRTTVRVDSDRKRPRGPNQTCPDIGSQRHCGL